MSTNRLLAIAAGALAALAPLAGDALGPGGEPEIDALEVAGMLRDDPSTVRILDLRSEGDFALFRLPRSERVDPAELEALAPDGRLVVLVGDAAVDARAAWLELRRVGHRRVRYMPDGAADWVEAIVSPVLHANATEAERRGWDRQAELSRYFGGFPRVVETPRREGDSTRDRVREAMRRGCAF